MSDAGGVSSWDVLDKWQIAQGQQQRIAVPLRAVVCDAKACCTDEAVWGAMRGSCCTQCMCAHMRCVQGTHAWAGPIGPSTQCRKPCRSHWQVASTGRLCECAGAHARFQHTPPAVAVMTAAAMRDCPAGLCSLLISTTMPSHLTDSFASALCHSSTLSASY